MRPKLRFLFLIAFFGFLNNVFCQTKPKIWNAADTTGKTHFSVFADTLVVIDQGLFQVQIKGENILFREDPFQVILKTKSSKWSPIMPGLYQQEDESGISLMDSKTGKRVSQRKFERIIKSESGLLAKEKQKPIWIWRPGQPEELEVDSFTENTQNQLLWTSKGMVVVDKNQRTNFISLPPSDRKFSPGFDYLLADSQWICLNRKQPDFSSFSGGFWWNDTAYLDTLKNLVYLQTPTQTRKKIADSARVASNQFLLIKQKRTWFVLTSMGKKIKTQKPNGWKILNDSLLAIKTSKNWRIVSLTGHFAEVNKTITEIHHFQDGLLLAKAGKRFGFIDLHGFIRIACRYDTILPFFNGRAAFRLENQWGCLDKNEKIIIQPHFEEISGFRNGIAAASRDKKWGLINFNGDIILPFEYDSISPERHSGWKIQRKGWKGWADVEGKIRIQPKYFNSIGVSGSWHKVIRESRIGLINPEGTIILPTDYQYITLQNAQGLILYY